MDEVGPVACREISDGAKGHRGPLPGLSLPDPDTSARGNSLPG